MNRLWMATLLMAVPAMANPTLVFGRLEHIPSNCRIVYGGRPLECNRLQISASGSSGVRLRFIGDDENSGVSYQLNFVSLDGDPGSPLNCDSSGCRLNRRSWNASLISTAWVRFDAQGLPMGLPDARTASGRCWIDARTISCESHSRNIPAMSAEAQL